MANNSKSVTIAPLHLPKEFILPTIFFTLVCSQSLLLSYIFTERAAKEENCEKCNNSNSKQDAVSSFISLRQKKYFSFTLVFVFVKQRILLLKIEYNKSVWLCYKKKMMQKTPIKT